MSYGLTKFSGVANIRSSPTHRQLCGIRTDADGKGTYILNSLLAIAPITLP